MKIYVFEVLDDELESNAIPCKEFDQFGDAFDYAQTGCTPKIYSIPVIDEVPDYEEGKLVWDWCDTTDRDSLVRLFDGCNPEPICEEFNSEKENVSLVDQEDDLEDDLTDEEFVEAFGKALFGGEAAEIELDEELLMEGPFDSIKNAANKIKNKVDDKVLDSKIKKMDDEFRKNFDTSKEGSPIVVYKDNGKTYVWPKESDRPTTLALAIKNAINFSTNFTPECHVILKGTNGKSYDTFIYKNGKLTTDLFDEVLKEIKAENSIRPDAQELNPTENEKPKEDTQNSAESENSAEPSKDQQSNSTNTADSSERSAEPSKDQQPDSTNATNPAKPPIPFKVKFQKTSMQAITDAELAKKVKSLIKEFPYQDEAGKEAARKQAEEYASKVSKIITLPTLVSGPSAKNANKGAVVGLYVQGQKTSLSSLRTK